MVVKVVQANFFHHFREKKWKKWKKLSWPTFSTTQAVLDAQIVEKVGFDNFFHFLYEFLLKFLESKKWWKKLSRPTFSTIFVKKTSS